jgi:hypothetical protein
MWAVSPIKLYMHLGEGCAEAQGFGLDLAGVQVIEGWAQVAGREQVITSKGIFFSRFLCILKKYK